MTPEHWRKVKDVFHAALDRAAEERAPFLDGACAGDQELRGRVERMLAADAKESAVIDKTAAGMVARLLTRDEAESFAGRWFAHYRLEREIGRGGMGRVYLAQDTRLKRPVALKLLPLAFSENAERVRRFQQEARVVSALNHPNIITIHEIGETDGLRFIVTEFVDGETLGDLISRGQRDLTSVIKIIIQVTEALTAAHGAGIVHRDIKPENIMVRRDGYVKVLDFGIAKLSQEANGGDDIHASQAPHRVVTTPGLVLGTVNYMSPEQARGHNVDARTDVFSLGVVLYEAVTGHYPFQGETRVDMLIAVAGIEPPPVREYTPGAPLRLQQIIERALRKNRDERYQTVDEMRHDLQELVTDSRSQQLLTTAAFPARTTTKTTGVATDSTRRKGKIVAVARWCLPALIAAVLTVGAYQWWHRGAPSSFDNIQVHRLTNIGQARFGAISPDGKFLGYAVRDELGGSLWLKQLGTNTTRVVMPPTGPVELWGLDFSADSNYFYYLIEDLTNRVGGTLYRVPVLGGEPRRVLAGLGSGQCSISPNNRQILFPRLSSQRANTMELTTVDADGSNERIVKALPADRFGTVAWERDSQSITLAASDNDAEGSYWRLVNIVVADGSEKPLSAKYRTQFPRSMSWLPNHSGLILVAPDEPSGVNQVWHLSYPEGILRRVTRDLHSYDRISMTADGKSLVTAQNDRESAIWVGPLAAPAAAATEARAITSNVNNIHGLSSTPAGKIVYSLVADNSEDIWEMKADGSDARQLTTNAGSNSYPSVSADGRYIVFTSTRSGRQQIWRIDRDGGHPTQLTNGNFNANFPHCSPAGNWVVFAAREPWAVWKVPLEGGAAVKLGDSSEVGPAISPDGRLVAYEYLDKTVKRIKLCVQSLEGGVITTIVDSDRAFSDLRWTLDGKAITYVSNSEGRKNIWAQPLAGGPPKKLTDFKTEWLMWFDWSRDGKQLISVRGRITSDIFLISNLE